MQDSPLKKASFLITATLALSLSAPNISYALLPPDLVVSVGAQVVGFFSLIVAVILSVFTSMGVLYFWFYEWFKRHVVQVAFGALALVLLASNALYLWQMQPTQTVIVSQYTEHPPGLQGTSSSQTVNECTTCAFFSDSLTVFVPDPVQPIVLQVDMNRRQETNGSFTHYYFLNGIINGDNFDQYTQFIKADYGLQANDFLLNIERILAEDTSVRDVYVADVKSPSGDTFTLRTAPLQGDFVTRSLPEYTQLKSVTNTQLQVNDSVFAAYVLVDQLMSNDYQKRIFFPGFADLESLTYQFVLWDEANAFYLINDTQVFSDTPAYPTHSWLLYKNQATGATKKGFETQINQLSDTRWEVTLPDFQNGLLDVSVLTEYHQAGSDRSRYVVTGKITDDDGVRSVSGLLTLVR